MLKTIKKIQSGFTIIELLIVIAVIAILALLTINNYVGVQAKGRDANRLTDINNIKDKLEEYYNENNGYPSTITASTFTGFDAENLKDPKGQDIKIEGVKANATDATGVAAPTASDTFQYVYVPYGDSGCTNNCKGFVLKSYIERPTTTITNPYVKIGANNE
jgi:prepilin-type N-terminal cleavage/methylation domain-containing protein